MTKTVRRVIALIVAIPIADVIDERLGIAFGTISYYFVGSLVFLTLIVISMLAESLLVGKRLKDGRGSN